MRNALLITTALAALAACSPPIPDSGPAAQATTRAAPPPDAASTAAAVLGVDGAGAQPDVQPPVTGAAPATAEGAPLSAMADDAATAEIPSDGATISDEQSFSAVSARETIASDAERIDANRAQYVVIEPTDLPPRPDGSGASIVAYALATTNVPGQALYRRLGLSGQARYERNCAKYGGLDKAQEAFLDAGGPKRDRFGLDPDGDGFACFWDPRPFRAAQGGAPAVVDTYEVIETPGDS